MSKRRKRHKRLKQANTSTDNTNTIKNNEDLCFEIAQKADRRFSESVLSQFEEEVICVDFNTRFKPNIKQTLSKSKYESSLHNWLEGVLSECEMVTVEIDDGNLDLDSLGLRYFTGKLEGAIAFAYYLELKGLLFAFRTIEDDIGSSQDRTDIPYDVAQEIGESMSRWRCNEQ